MRSTDVNADCFINVVDLVYEINYLLRGGPPPSQDVLRRDLLLRRHHLLQLRKWDSLTSGMIKNPELSELPVYANFDVPVAGVALSLTWDPEEFSFLEPILTPRTEGLGLYYSSQER